MSLESRGIRFGVVSVALVAAFCVLQKMACGQEPDEQRQLESGQRTDRLGDGNSEAQSIEEMFDNVARAKAKRAKADPTEHATDAPAGVNGLRSQGLPGFESQGRLSPRSGTLPSSHVPFSIQHPENSLRRHFGAGGGLFQREDAAERVTAFRDDLGKFDRQCASLLQLMRDDSLRNPAIRTVLPMASRISSDARMLLQNVGPRGPLTELAASYRVLDQGWRQFAFRLHDVRISNDALAAVQQCEQLINRMSSSLGMGPQFDRHGMHDLLLVMATNLQTLSGDLRLADVATAARQRLSRELRLMRQNALNSADRVGEENQQQVVRGLSELATRWRLLSPELSRVIDAHVQRSAQNVAENFRRAHALVWMEMPQDEGRVPASASRLELLCRDLVGQLNSRTAIAGEGLDRDRLLVAADQVLKKIQVLNLQIGRQDPRPSVQKTFSELDRGWQGVAPLLRNSALVNPATLTGIHSELDRLRQVFATAGAEGKPVEVQSLLQTAAAIESTAAFVDSDLRRFSRLLSPPDFRERLLNASAGFHQHATRFHQLLDQRADLAAVEQAAGVMEKSWQRLSVDLRDIESHGISAQRGSHLKRDLAELVEYMAAVTSALKL